MITIHILKTDGRIYRCPICCEYVGQLIDGKLIQLRGPRVPTIIHAYTASFTAQTTGPRESDELFPVGPLRSDAARDGRDLPDGEPANTDILRQVATFLDSLEDVP